MNKLYWLIGLLMIGVSTGCNSDTATIFISGATFLTVRATSSDGIFGVSSSSNQAIESISVVAKDRDGELLLSASYDNKNDILQASSAGNLARLWPTNSGRILLNLWISDFYEWFFLGAVNIWAPVGTAI